MTRWLFYVLAVGAVSVGLWLAIVTGPDGAAADEPPPTFPPETVTTTVTVDARDGGKTAAGWHRVARRYLTRVRYLIHGPQLAGHWLERAFACVHDGEGAWSANTGNGYYGGLQMDLSFQRSYGDWALRAFGTADRWPASVQMATAIRAYTAGRGFHPWPNTARACGLIP